LEIGDEDFDCAAGVQVTYQADRFGEDMSAAVGLIVACYTGYHGVAEIQVLHGFCDTARFVFVETIRMPGLDSTETAVAGADIAEDHKRGCASAPALADVRAVRTLADGMEPGRFDQPLKLTIFLPIRGFCFYPFGTIYHVN